MRIVAALGLLLLSSSLLAEEPASISVTLASGRTMTGVPDRRSTEEHLWLRSGQGSLSIARPIEWTSITALHRDQAELTTEDVLKLAESDNGQLLAAKAIRQVEPGRIVIVKPIAPATASTKSQPPQAVPTTLRLDAAVDNFDDDAENDGLVVELRMLDQHGKQVAFNGTARIRWTGPQARKNTAQSPPHTVTLGNWSVPITSNGSSQPITVSLPFQTRNPERDLTLYNYSLVEVTLTIPGVGNFAAERDGVRIRRWEPHRDFMQVHPNGPIVTRSSRRP